MTTEQEGGKHAEKVDPASDGKSKQEGKTLCNYYPDQ
jgi:hypothetical protein